MWLVCVIVTPLVAIGAAVGIFILVSEALEKRFSGGIALSIVFSISFLFVAKGKIKRAKRQIKSAESAPSESS